MKTLVDMQKLAASRGFEFLSSCYNGCMKKHEWKCSKGHTWDARPNDIQSGCGCPYCAGKRKNISDIVSRIKGRPIRLVSTQYCGTHRKYSWECIACGYNWEAVAYSVMSGVGCPKCAGRAYSIDDIKQIGCDHGFELVSTTYLGSSKKHKWRCQDGHEFWKSPCKIRSGEGCPICHTYRGEEKCRFVFEQLTNKLFPPFYRAFGTRMQIDGFCKELNIAFEYHGKQHYAPVKYWDRGDSFTRRQSRDSAKREICRNQGVVLIEVAYSEQDIERFITESLLSNEVSLYRQRVNWKEFKGNSIRLAQIKEAAKSIHLECLEENYVSARSPMRFQCQRCGREFTSTSNDVKNGNGCLRCSGRMKQTIQDMLELAKTWNLEFLSPEYINARTKHLWRCFACETQFWKMPYEVKQGKTCPNCGRSKGRLKRNLLAIP